MDPAPPILSAAFQDLYCNPALFERLSAFHPVSFTRVLPFQLQDPLVDNPDLLAAETAHLANPSHENRLAVVEAFGQCGLLSESDVANLKPILDFFDVDFFEFMGEIYANAAMFICALRWHREFIVELEERRPRTVTDNESVYASVGYCLYSLGLYPEAITWSKSCIGPRQTVDTVCRALINYEADGSIKGIERLANRTRYTVSTLDPAHTAQLTQRLKARLKIFAPLQETYIDWIRCDATAPEIQADGYPFQSERDAGALTHHRMNLIFSLAAQADELVARGYLAEATQRLLEALHLEPIAEFIRDRLRTIP